MLQCVQEWCYLRSPIAYRDKEVRVNPVAIEESLELWEGLWNWIRPKFRLFCLTFWGYFVLTCCSLSVRVQVLLTFSKIESMYMTQYSQYTYIVIVFIHKYINMPIKYLYLSIYLYIYFLIQAGKWSSCVLTEGFNVRNEFSSCEGDTENRKVPPPPGLQRSKKKRILCKVRRWPQKELKLGRRSGGGGGGAGDIPWGRGGEDIPASGLIFPSVSTSASHWPNSTKAKVSLGYMVPRSQPLGYKEKRGGGWEMFIMMFTWIEMKLRSNIFWWIKYLPKHLVKSVFLCFS